MNDDANKPKKPLPFWPGMPTTRSKLFELLFQVLLPLGLALFGITLALLMSLVESCRNATLN